jgi:hypothetical protein
VPILSRIGAKKIEMRVHDVFDLDNAAAGTQVKLSWAGPKPDVGVPKESASQAEQKK